MIRDEIKEIMINKEEIENKVKELGKRITNDYKEITDELVVVGLLRGSVVFMADLVRQIDLPVILDFMTVSSYGNEKESSREVKILKDLDENIMGKDVLVVEDIIDSGLTLEEILKILKSRHPKSIKLCTLLNKPDRREVDIFIDYNGFSIPDKFIVGYGLDFSQRYRNLPYIGIMKGE